MPDDSKPCDVHSEQLKNLEIRQSKTDEILDKVRNRPPVWATFVMGALLMVIGYLISLAKMES